MTVTVIVSDNKHREQGLLGVVADIVKVDKEYEVAVETALGGSIQNIVTEDEDTAKRMIQFLKKNKFGRATFLPLTSIQSYGNFHKPEALKETGVVGVASTLVKVDAKYKDLAGYLLGRTLVVDHIDHGIAIARKYKQSIRIVTLEGELINAGGSMTGGAFKNSSNLLSRRREIEEFEKTVKQLKSEMDQLEEYCNGLRKERAGYYEEIEKLKEKLQKAYVIQNTAKMNLDQSQGRIKAIFNTLEDIESEAGNLDRQITDIMDNQESITVELDTSEHLEEELSVRIDADQSALEKEREIETEKQRTVEELHLVSAGLEQKEAFVVENVTRIQDELDKFSQEMEELEENKGGTSKEIEEKEEQIADLRQTIENSKVREKLLHNSINPFYRNEKNCRSICRSLTRKYSVWRARRKVMRKPLKSRLIICGKSMRLPTAMHLSFGTRTLLICQK